MLPRAFIALGYRSTVICGRLQSQPPSGVGLVQTGIIVPGQPGKGLVRSLFEPLLAFRVIIRQRPDIVIVSPIRSSLLSIFPLILIYRVFVPCQTKFVLKTDWSLDYSGLGGLSSQFSNLLLAASSRIMNLVSIETSCGVSRAQNLPLVRRARIRHIPIGYPQGLIELKRYEDGPRWPIILCVARITRTKGQNILLAAFAEIAKRHPDWKLRFAGPVEDNAFMSELKAQAHKSSLEARVSFLGPISEADLDREYHRASIFCLPSLQENAGNVRFEAVASGLPVIATDVPCASDATELGWFVVRAGDQGDLSTVLEELMKSPATRAQGSTRAQARLISYTDVAQSYISTLAGTR